MTGDATDGASCGKMRQQNNDSSVEISINSHSQIATQPFDDTGDEVATQSFQQKIWGQLYPHSGTFPRIELVGDSFKLGRAQSNDYVVQKTDMVNEKLFLAISKTQCEVFRNSDGVFLKDYSSNGTWLNGEKIGKNMVRPLDHDSEICFAGANKKVFVFRSMDAQKEVFPEELTKNYLVSKELGKGACGIVRLGFRTKDLHRVAIKIINKKQTKTAHTSSAAIMNEVNILRKVKHPCIINLEDVIDTKEAKLHFYQLASAIQYLHASNICHRDLKPENVLLCSIDDSKPVIKVTDMGLSKLVNLGNELKTFCGTPNYLAPEIIVMTARGGTYDYKVDCWSLGVILYILLSGTPPFTDERQCDKKLREQILTANFIFYPQLFNSVSKEAKDLITKLLKVRPEERLSADEILEHPWLQDQAMRTEAHALMKEQEVKSQNFYVYGIMTAATACLKWVDVLENQFDKSWVDLDLLFNAIDEATVIFQNNAKLEAQLLHLREELVQYERTQQKLVHEKAYITHSLVNALAENHKFKHTRDGERGEVKPLRDEGGTGSLSTPSSPRKDYKLEAVGEVNKVVEDDSSINKEASSFSKQIEENLDVQIESESLIMQDLRVENEDLKLEILDLESELVGARLDNVYLDKELAGRIQQIQILTSGTPPEVKERLWTQIEAEMCLQRSKTIAQICKSKQELRSKRIESSCEDSKASPSKPIAPVNLCGDKRTDVDSYDHELELEHGYSKGKQVNVLKNPADDLGMAIIGGKEHNLPIIISEVFPNSAVYRSDKIQAGDIILSVNDQDFSSVNHDEAVQFLSSLRGPISFQLMASENVCEDDPSNLNFRFYRIFDPDHQIGGHGSRQTDSNKKPNNTTPVKHPGKAVNIQSNKAKVDAVTASTTSTKVDPNRLAMSPVHKKNSGQMSKAASIKQLNKEPSKENAQLIERKCTDPPVGTNIVGTTTTHVSDVIADVVKNGVDLCVEDGSIAHL